jgi:hypothetical protein
VGQDPGDAFTFDVLAASIRADAADLGIFMEVLGSKLEGALPGEVEIKRQGGLFRRNRAVEALSVKLGDRRFDLRHEPPMVRAQIARSARGITLRTDEVSLDAWIAELSKALEERASASAEARAALTRMLQ